MKKFIMAIVCLMTMVLSVNAQIKTPKNIYEDFYDSLAIETPSYHNTISINYIGKNRFELVRYVIGKGFFGNKKLERSVLLYKGDIDSMIDFFSYILNKAKEWNEICIQNNSPWVNKQIIGTSVKIDKKNNSHKQLKDWNQKYNVEFGYNGKGDFIVAFDKEYISRVSFYKENDLVFILDFINCSKVKNYIKVSVEKEEIKSKENQEREKISQMLL